MADPKVRIEYGADSEEFTALVGQDVGSGIIAARTLLRVPGESEARLNGSPVIDTAVILKDRDVISFYKASGSKGY